MTKSMGYADNAKGKLVDTWVYQYKGVQDHPPTLNDEDEVTVTQFVQEKKVSVDLRLMKKYEDADTPPKPVKAVWFRLLCPEAAIEMEGTDVEALRTAMWEKLDTKYEIQWFDYLLVEVRPEGVYDGIGTAMSFSWTRVEKGIAWDNTELLREHRYHSYETISPWPGEFRNQQGVVLACILDTEQNQKALTEFRDRIDLMRERLATFLTPETIMKTLGNMSQNLLLPPLPARGEE